MSIQDRILGAWELISFVGYRPDGAEISPMGRQASGSLVYAPGYVSANLSRGDRVRNAPDTMFHNLADADLALVARGYMAYSGPYAIDEERAVITHDFRMCIDPALIGTVQERHVRFLDDKLELSVRAAAGVALPSTLVWRRA